MEEIINLSKIELPKIDLSKDDGTEIKRLFVGLTWGENTYTGEDPYDIDLVGSLTDSSARVKYPQHLVNWSAQKAGQKWEFAKFYGDNQTGNDNQGITFNGKHYDEAIEFYADKIPEGMTDFYIGAYIHLGTQRLQNFGMIPGACMELIDMDDPDKFHARYEFCSDEKFEDLTAVEIGKFTKRSSGVSFRVIEKGFDGGGVALFAHHGLAVKGC